MQRIDMRRRPRDGCTLRSAFGTTARRTPAEAAGKSFNDTIGAAGRKRTNSRIDMTRGSTAAYAAAQAST
ncbi:MULTISPECIES: hypothetical protein [Burkholderia]|uniref:hypothetical protein n=1 Tax=Burkholderia TaxID=32008 RepID=UPI00126A298F|nr:MULTISPECIES: hypothetical protein [Burkholderia]